MADDVELIREHYGDFTGLYDPGQAVAHVRILLAERDEWAALFEAQCRRMEAATALWQQEDLSTRTSVLPNLGQLLAWLMDQRASARAAGFAEAIAMLCDDDRYQRWWTKLPEQDPAYGYWQAPARKHLADYLQTVGVAPVPAPGRIDELNPIDQKGAQ